MGDLRPLRGVRSESECRKGFEVLTGNGEELIKDTVSVDGERSLEFLWGMKRRG